MEYGREIEKIYQFEISKEDIEEIGRDVLRDRRGYSLRNIMRSYSYWSGSTTRPNRLTTSGWYLPVYSGEDDIDPNNPKFYEKSGSQNTSKVFSIVRVYGQRCTIYEIDESQWKYFKFRQVLAKDDVIMKNSNYHVIEGFMFSGYEKKPVHMKIRSLVTGTSCSVSFAKIPKMKVYELSDRQKKNIQSKVTDMKKKVQSALESTEITLVPRNRLGMQSKFTRNNIEVGK